VRLFSYFSSITRDCSFISRLESAAAGLSPGFSSKGGQKPEGGGYILKILYWMYAATRTPNVKGGGTDFKYGSGHHWPPAGDGLAQQRVGNVPNTKAERFPIRIIDSTNVGFYLQLLTLVKRMRHTIWDVCFSIIVCLL